MLTLDQVRDSTKCKVESLQVSGKLLKKFLDMGFVRGTQLEFVREAPLFDPIELKVHNYYVSIRKEEAKGIKVSTL